MPRKCCVPVKKEIASPSDCCSDPSANTFCHQLKMKKKLIKSEVKDPTTAPQSAQNSFPQLQSTDEVSQQTQSCALPQSEEELKKEQLFEICRGIQIDENVDVYKLVSNGSIALYALNNMIGLSYMACHEDMMLAWNHQMSADLCVVKMRLNTIGDMWPQHSKDQLIQHWQDLQTCFKKGYISLDGNKAYNCCICTEDHTPLGESHHKYNGKSLMALNWFGNLYKMLQLQHCCDIRVHSLVNPCTGDMAISCEESYSAVMARVFREYFNYLIAPFICGMTALFYGHMTVDEFFGICRTISGRLDKIYDRDIFDEMVRKGRQVDDELQFPETLDTYFAGVFSTQKDPTK